MNTYIIDGVYTPRASVKKGQSKYSQVHPQELLTTCIKELQVRQGDLVNAAQSAYFGCVSQVGDQGANIARNAILSAGLDQSMSAVSLNMCCGSGLESVLLAASVVSAPVSAAMGGLALAGGVESMSRVKMASDGGGMDGNNETLRRTILQEPQGIAADHIAEHEKISREELDSFALSSHNKAAKALSEDYFQANYAFVKDDSGNILLTKEDHARADTSLEALAKLKSSFISFHTAGNSSGIADGAASVLVANEATVNARGLKPRARILAVASSGSDPVEMLTGPAACALSLLAKLGMQAKNVDLWEINEAFAVVPLYTIKRLGIDPGKVNIKGGAIALGHPLGATGSILLMSLINSLEKENKQTGCAVLCVAGGQSVAILIERV